MITNDEIKEIVLKNISDYQNDKKVIKRNRIEFEYECLELVPINGLFANSPKLALQVESVIDKLISEKVLALDADNNIYLAKYLQDENDFMIETNIIV